MDLPTLWAAIIAFAVMAYVVLDGFDLGVGLLFPFVDGEAERDEINARILEDVNASGRAFLSHTKLGGHHVLRLAIGNIRTERRHVVEAWTLLRDAASRISCNTT